MCLHEHVDEYVLASVTDPYFKLRWGPSTSVARVQVLLLSRAAAQMKNMNGSATSARTSTAGTDDFFYSVLLVMKLLNQTQVQSA